MSDQVNKAYQATPAATLEQQIMDPNFPKNEREWWAAARIEQLEAALRPFACECVGFCKDAKHNYGEVEPIETCKYGRNRAALGEERT